jgi:uncharacterized membrane protein
MSNFNKYKYVLILTLVSASIGLTSSLAHGSTISIKNDDTAEVKISIEPGEGHMSIFSGNKKAIELVLQPGEEKDVEISKKLFGNADVYTITGTVKMISLYNKCFPLDINKNYKVVFVGGRAGGTVCTALPVKD